MTWQTLSDAAKDLHMSPETLRRVLTPRQAAERLQVGVSTVYALAARGAIPSLRVGRSVRIPEAA